MSDPFIGEITIFGGDFAPKGWAFCNGQLLSIAANTALFSILGTTYGGNGITTFALPDLRGRCAIGPRQGPGLSDHTEGAMSGTPSVTLISPQLPSHHHATPARQLEVAVSGQVAVPVSSSAGTTNTPINNVQAAYTSATFATAADGNDTLEPASVAMSGTPSPTMHQTGITGGSSPVAIQNPYLAMNYIICLAGIFPSRG